MGDTAPELTYTATGLVSGETLKTEPTLAYETGPDMTTAGTTAIKASGADGPSHRFTDVDPGQWYHEAVDYVVSHDLMNGFTTTTFAPNATTTRGQIVTILYRLEGEPAAGKADFTDTD